MGSIESPSNLAREAYRLRFVGLPEKIWRRSGQSRTAVPGIAVWPASVFSSSPRWRSRMGIPPLILMILLGAASVSFLGTSSWESESSGIALCSRGRVPVPGERFHGRADPGRVHIEFGTLSRAPMGPVLPVGSYCRRKILSCAGAGRVNLGGSLLFLDGTVVFVWRGSPTGPIRHWVAVFIVSTKYASPSHLEARARGDVDGRILARKEKVHRGTAPPVKWSDATYGD